MKATGHGEMLNGALVRVFLLGAALAAVPLALQAQPVEETVTGAGGDIHYETSDPVGSPPVNYRSGYDDEYSSPETRDAEMYAEEYERRKQQELIREREQLDRINNFSSGAITTEGVMGGRR